jgi:beta-catenin-like protein 1
MSHLLGIIASLFTNLDSDSPERIRLLTKFVEGDYEKVDRLLDVRENAEIRLKTAEREIEAERHVREWFHLYVILMTRV